MPTFVYFDLDDTLLDHRGAERAALADVVARHRADFDGLPLAHVQHVYHGHNVALWQAYGEGRLTRDDVQHLRFARTLADLGVTHLDADAVGAAYLARYAAHWAWLPGAEAAFARVAQRYPVGLLTNGFAEVQRAKLDRFPALRTHSRAVVISEDVGVMKPQPGIFAHATAAAATPAADILYIGDSKHSDVDGGVQAGWQVAWFGGPPDADVFTFTDWAQLLAWLAV